MNYKIKALMPILTLIVFTGCQNEMSDKDDNKVIVKELKVDKVKKEEVKKEEIKQEEVKKVSDFDEVKETASRFGTAISSYMGKKYDDLSKISKEVLDDTSDYTETKYMETKAYYAEVSGKKEEEAKLRKKIEDLEKEIEKKEKKKHQIFGAQLKKETKDNLDYELNREVKKNNDSLKELKKELNIMTKGIQKERNDFNKINRPQQKKKEK